MKALNGLGGLDRPVKVLLCATMLTARRHPSPAIRHAFNAWFLWRFGSGLTQAEAAKFAGASLSYTSAIAQLSDVERERVARGVAILARVRPKRSPVAQSELPLPQPARPRPEDMNDAAIEELLAKKGDRVMAALDRITWPASKQAH